MFKQLIRRISSVSSRTATAIALVIVVVVAGVALFFTRGSSEANADPAMQPRAARLDRVDGSVGIGRAEAADKETDWTDAAVNMPITVGERLYARDYAHASISLSGQNFVRLNPATSLDVLALEDHRTQFALRNGSAVFDVGALSSDELYEVATPCGAVDFKQPGLYQIGMDGGAAVISVLNGLAQVVGQEGSGSISKGQVYTLTSATTTEALASSLAPRAAGEIVDDYYRYRYPKVYNGRYRSYDAYLADPSYYDPFRTSVSYQYLPADIPGLYDLDDYGDWVDVSNYGHCWAPRVSTGWAPFRSGYWDLDDLWGPSWVSSEPWGWAPYHYGRWAFVNQRWFWVPVEVRTRPVYYAAPVAFIPLGDQIGWAPLGPGEVCVSRYYDNFRPRYFASAEVIRAATAQNTFVNFGAPGAVTVVPLRAMNRLVDARSVVPFRADELRRSHAVLDPFSVSGIRELATKRDNGRRQVKFERREQEALNTAVLASSTPRVLPARGDLAKRLRVEATSENRKDGKLAVKDNGEVTSLRRPDGLPQHLGQSQQMNELASRAEQGDKSARREMRQLMREAQQQPAARQQALQSQQQIKQQRRAERQQQFAAAQQTHQQQMKQQGRVESRRQSAVAQQVHQQQMKQPQQQIRHQEQMRQPRNEPKSKPPEASLQRGQLRRPQQEALRQSQMGRQREQRKVWSRVDPHQSMMQQQAARAQAAQHQSMMQQQAARAQAVQRQSMMQQQAARAQSVQRQSASRPQQHAPALLGPPIRQDAGSQGRVEKAQRRPPQ